MLLAVKAGAVAMPEALVVAVAVRAAPGKVPLAPELGAVNVTFTAGMGLLPESVTITERALANGVFTVVTWWFVAPAITTAAGSPRVFVYSIITTPIGLMDAITGYSPIVPFAVKVGIKATPCASVMTVATRDEPGKVPPAPEAGAEKVTGTPGMGFKF